MTMTRTEVLELRKQQVAALESSMRTATPWPGPGPKPTTWMDAADLQARIDKLRADWAREDATPPAPAPEPGGPNPSDAWRNAQPGSKVKIGEDWFIVVSLGPFGNSIAPTDPPAEHPVARIILVEAIVDFLRGKLLTVKEPAAQAAFSEVAVWVGGEASK